MLSPPCMHADKGGEGKGEGCVNPSSSSSSGYRQIWEWLKPGYVLHIINAAD